jgi:ABC-type Zn uptake system ZnuABC Zn-binding protein ZnuA
VQVADLAPPRAQPQGLRLGTAQRREIGQAGLLIEVGDGYQPQVEQASAKLRLALLPALSAQPYPYEFWLDPTLAGRAATLVANALTRADPAGRAQFQNGARDFQALVSSLNADYESSLSTCSGDRFVTSDDAFGRLAATYNLVEVAVSTSGERATAALVTKDRVPVVFSEVGVATGPVERAAQAAGVPVKSLDPLEVAPSPTEDRPATYFDVMENDLTALEGALACDTTSNYY